MTILINNDETVTMSLDHYKELLEQYKQLSDIVKDIKKRLDDSQFGEVSTESWSISLPRFEIPDWVCEKQDFCVTTPGPRRWNIRECNAEAELVCVSYGIKYGTPASMRPGRCENLPDNDI